MGIEHTVLSLTFVLLEAFFRINVEHTDPQEGLEKAETDPEEGLVRAKTDREEGLEKAETSTTERYAHCPYYYCTIRSIKI